MRLPYGRPLHALLERSYSQEQLYTVVADVEHYREFVPWCQRSEVIQSKPPSFVEAELEVGFKMFVERWRPCC